MNIYKLINEKKFNYKINNNNNKKKINFLFL